MSEIHYAPEHFALAKAVLPFVPTAQLVKDPTITNGVLLVLGQFFPGLSRGSDRRRDDAAAGAGRDRTRHDRSRRRRPPRRCRRVRTAERPAERDPRSDPYAGAMQVLVTGAAGFIGSNFVRHWVNEHPGDGVVALDLLTYAGNRDNLADVDDRITFVEGDIGDLDLDLRGARARDDRRDRELRRRVAQQPRGARSRSGSSAPTCSAPKRCSRRRATVASRASTTSRRARSTAISPSTTRAPSPKTRRTGRARRTTRRRHRPTTTSRAYHETFGVPITISNCSNNYGPYQFPEKVVPYFTTLALDDKPLPLYASTDHKREWLHVLDHCRAVEQIVLRGRDGETYNVGSDREATIDEIADLVLDTLGKPDSLKTIVPDRPGHDRRYLLDSTKLRRELGLGAADRVRPGLARHRRVVRREPCAGGSRCSTAPRWWRRPGAPAPPPRASPVRVLVAGAGGQVGARVVECLGDHEVLAAAHDVLDLADREQVEQVVGTFRPDAVVNAAAMTNVDACERDPERAFAVNALGVRNLAVAAERAGAHVVHISTDYVFDGESHRPVRRVGRGRAALGVRAFQARRRGRARGACAARGRSSARRGCSASAGATSSAGRSVPTSGASSTASSPTR